MTQAIVAGRPLQCEFGERGFTNGPASGTRGLRCDDRDGSALFIAPPLIVEEKQLMKVLEALDQGLELADAESS